MLMWILLSGLVWPFVAAAIWKSKISYQEVAIQMVVVTILVSGVWAIGTYAATSDQH